MKISSSHKLQSAVIEITNACNLRCAHCASSSGRSRKNELSTEEISDLLKQIRDLGAAEITVIGGEFLVRPDWFTICSKVRSLGLKLILVTNGLLVDQEVRKQLIELSPAVIGISLDGPDPVSYQNMRGVDGFQKAMDVIYQLKSDNHKQVNAITTFTRTNLPLFSKFVSLFSGSGICWQIQLVNTGGDRLQKTEILKRSDYKIWVDEVEKALLNPDLLLVPMDDLGYFPVNPNFRFLHQTWTGCIAGKSLIGVRSNGDILGCLSLDDSFVTANIRSRPLAEIWDFGFNKLRNKVLKGDCATCAYGNDCGAGCAAMAVTGTGDIGCNPYCIRSLETTDALSFI